MVSSSLIWSNDQSSAWFMLRGSFFSFHVPLTFILLSFKTFALFIWMYSTGRLFLAWEFFPWMQITVLNLSQLVQEVCLMNHLEEIEKRIKRRKTNAEHYTTLEQPISYLTYAKCIAWRTVLDGSHKTFSWAMERQGQTFDALKMQKGYDQLRLLCQFWETNLGQKKSSWNHKCSG